MYRQFALYTALSVAVLLSAAATAGPEDFYQGSTIENYGKIAAVDSDFKIPNRAKFKVLFDTSKKAKPGEINQSLNSVARFINMHADAGVPVKRIDAAIVFHGKGSFDLTKDGLYGTKSDGKTNANAELIAGLNEFGVRIILCGQSAAYHGIEKNELLPGVELALSAMTAHALLQQDGYTLNPF